MRIGIDARMYGPESTTGIGAYIKNLTAALFAVDTENEYVLFLREPVYSSFQPPNPRVKKVKADIPWYGLAEQIRLPFILWRAKLDLMHFPHFNAAIFYPKKFIITVHDITPRFFPGPRAKKSWFRRLGYGAVFRLGLWRARKIIAISRHTSDHLVKYYSVPKEKIAVTYLGAAPCFDAEAPLAQMAAFKAKYNLNRPFIFYVGVWRDHKNLETLIRAFELVKAAEPDLLLVLGGKADWRYPEILRAVEASPYKTDIIRPGYIAEEELPYFYRAAKMFVLPSYCEGFGLVALEALACGTPVIGSETTSLPEILGAAALFFDPRQPQALAAAIRRLLTEPDLHARLSALGKEQVKKYSWRDCGQDTLAVYRVS